MNALIELPLEAAIPLLIAFVANTFAEWALLTIDKPIMRALAKSAKAVIIPALIAAYALLIADVVAR